MRELELSLKIYQFCLSSLPVTKDWADAGCHEFCLMLDEVNEDIGGAVDGGEEAGGARDILYPHRPVKILLIKS